VQAGEELIAAAELRNDGIKITIRIVEDKSAKTPIFY
jgi:hypothetical protein